MFSQNGEGKSTLAKLILGTLKPTSGSIIRHPLLTIGYFSQHSVEELSIAPLSLPSPSTGAQVATTALSYFLWKLGENGVNVEERDARACLGSFGLQGRIASDTPLKALSGGQKVCEGGGEGCGCRGLMNRINKGPSLILTGSIGICFNRVQTAKHAVSEASPTVTRWWTQHADKLEYEFYSLLDEVTTHVDAPTIRGLALALREFTGAIVLVTHDR